MRLNADECRCRCTAVTTRTDRGKNVRMNAAVAVAVAAFASAMATGAPFLFGDLRDRALSGSGAEGSSGPLSLLILAPISCAIRT